MNKCSTIQIDTGFFILQTNVVVIISLYGAACNVPTDSTNWSNFYTLSNQYRAPKKSVCSVCMFSNAPSKELGMLNISPSRAIKIWNYSGKNADHVWGSIVY